MNAWLLTWEGTSPAINASNKIVAIIASRRSNSFVHDVVDLLYGRSVGSAYDAVRAANRRKERKGELLTTYSTSERFFFGRNPLIFARRVSHLTVSRNESEDTETVAWIDPPYLRIENPGELPVVTDPQRRCLLVRRLHAPLSGELYPEDGSSTDAGGAPWYSSEAIE